MNHCVRRLLGLMLGLGAGLAAAAQPAPIQFGKPDPKDFEAATFAHDTAAAVVLCDYGTSAIRTPVQTRQLYYERTVRTKILRAAGVPWATVEIPLYGYRQELTTVRGFTYNLVNGVVVKDKLDAETRQTKDLTDYFRVCRFVLPNVHEGSVIEFTYRIVEPYALALRPWQFQYFIPVRWSEYRASFPSNFKYRAALQGYVPAAEGPAVAHSAGTVPADNPLGRQENYRWAMKDVPAFEAEPYSTSPNDYLARLDLELVDFTSADLTTNWRTRDAYMLDDVDFGRAIEGNGFLKAAVAQMPPPPAPLLERIAAVHALVRGAVKCTGRNSMWASAPLRKTFLETHRGGAADINLLLIAALRAAGIEANPLILSTRDNGRLRVGMPWASRFNYVLAHVRLPDGHDLLLDATEPLLPVGMLPERCLNHKGRLVLKAGGPSRWLDIEPGQRRTHFQQAKLRLAADGSLRGTVHEEYVGYAAAAQRAMLEELGEPQYRRKFVGQHSTWAVPVFAVADRTDLAKPLALNYEFIQANHPTGAAAGAGASTIFLGLFDGFTDRRNPFRREGRTCPVDFATTQEETLMLTLTLPPGYEVRELPKPAIVDLPDGGGRYTLQLAAAEGEVQLTSRLSLRKAVYSVEEYASLRELYRLMLEKQAEQLVIQKKP